MPKDYTGQKFHRLTVVRLATEYDCKTSKIPKWVCVCECGNIIYSTIYKLISGETKSCGCWRRDNCITRNTKHNSAHRGKVKRLYVIWLNMRQRCHNPKTPRYKDYGKKGILVYPEWNSYPMFEKWALENGYKEGLTIDRKDPSGNYEPSNCVWISRIQNTVKDKVSMHKEDAMKLLLQGMTNREVADKFGLHIATVIRWSHQLELM